MKVEIQSGSMQAFAADAIIVNLFESVTVPGGATGALDQALGGAIQDLIAAGDLTGKAGEVLVFYPLGQVPARRVLVAGLGKPESFNLEEARRASAAAFKRARELGAKHVATIVHGAGIGGMDPVKAAQATVEGALLGLYRYNAHRQVEEPRKEIETLTVVEFDPARLALIGRGVRAAEAITAGVYLARDLVNLPPNSATPGYLAAVAAEIARTYGLELTVGDRQWASERKMGAFLGVAQGAGEPPQFIVLEYNPAQASLPTIVIVGKGITFDSGGLSIKPADHMGDMKSDMAGAAAVLATMKVAAMLALPVHLVGIAPCTDNMPDGNAYHNGDVLTASNGKTIEIISTDAEGRLVLADALVYAARYNPAAVIDLATLTGACVVALGDGMAAGLFASDEALRQRLLASAEATHERLWPMPLWEDYKKAIKSNVADMKNSGGRYGGVATSAIFLKEFTSYPWAHLDMASMALSDKPSDYIPAGGTGYGVRLLVDLLQNWK